MAITIDGLCKLLDIKRLKNPQDYTSLRKEFIGTQDFPDNFYAHIFADEERAKLMDAYSLPGHKSIARLVNKEIGDADSVIELGFGTGFRSLFYALNHPETRFYCIDKRPEAKRLVMARIGRLGVTNIELHLADFMGNLQLSAPVVLAIDCIPEKVSSADFHNRVFSYVNSRDLCSKLLLVYYNQPVKGKLKGLYKSILGAGGFDEMSTVNADYQNSEGRTQISTLIKAKR